MLLEKLNGTVPCLLDTTTIPPEELALKPSRSGADSGICEGPGAGGARHSNGEPSSASSGHPYNRTFSPHFHAFVELCLQRDPEKRLMWLQVLWPLRTRARVNAAAGLSGVMLRQPCWRDFFLSLFHLQTFGRRPRGTSLLQTGA